MIKKTLRLATILFLLALLIGSTQAAITTTTEVNLILNPSFEIAGAEPQTAAAWSGTQTPEGYTGSYCGQALAAIMENQANTFSLVYTPQIPFGAQNIEIFSFWAKGFSAYDSVRVYFGTSDGAVSQRIDLTQVWAFYEIDLNALLVAEDMDENIIIEDISFLTELNPEYQEPEYPYNVIAYIDDVFGGYVEVTVTRQGIDLTYFYYALYVVIIAGFVVLFLVVVKAKSNQR